MIEAVYLTGSRKCSGNMQQHVCAAALMKYIKLLEYKKVPVDLDNFFYLSNMELDALEQRELGNLPANVTEDILVALS